MKKLLILLFATIISLSLYSQEICDNGIDDDGDNLIDLNDPDCDCHGIGIPTTLPSLIPNPSFEDHDTCEATWCSQPGNSNLECLDYWTQAGPSTCDWHHDTIGGWNGVPGNTPFPDGNSAVGVFAMASWQEYVGGCLLDTLVADSTYELTFQISFAWVGSYVQESECNYTPSAPPPLPFTLYGTGDCVSNLPFSGTNYDCPTVNSAWDTLGSVLVDPANILQNWQEVTITFTPDHDITGFILGPPCDVASYGYTQTFDPMEDCYPYFLFDDLQMQNSGVYYSQLEIDSIGNSCTDLSFNAHIDTVGGTFQWYYEGVALIGETNSTIDITGNDYPEGTYQVVFDYGTDCLQAEISFAGAPATVIMSNDTTICVGETVNITASNCNTYAWDQSLGSAASHTITPTVTTTYTVIGTNTEGCTDEDSVTITVIELPNANAGDDVYACIVSTTITATGGGTYQWNNSLGSGATHTVSPTITTEYIVTVTDSYGCIDIDTVMINLGSIEFDTTIVNTNCFGSSDGSIILTLDGTAPYVINWDNGNTTNTLQNINAGNYTVTATDDDGCELINTFTVNQPTAIQSQSIITNISCFGGNDGGIDLTVSGGTPPYTFAWDDPNSQITEDAANLSTNTYSVIVTDNNNCSITHTTTVTQPTQLVTSTTPTNISCFGLSDGEIDLSITGGTPPYSFNWSNSQHSEDINSLYQNTYSVTVEDANGCTITNSEIVTEPLEIIITENSNSILCHGDETGIIDISASQGTAPYTYNWSNQTNNEDLTNVAAGTYIVTVTDVNNCSATNSISINEPNLLVVSLPNNFTHCNHSTDILATVEGGTTPYNYIWNDGSTTQNTQYQTNNTATYSVLVTDNNGCTAEDLIEVTIISVNLEVFANKDTVCPGDPILVTTSIVGGMPPYTIYDNGNIATFPIIVYPNGIETYTLQVVDACGNTDNAEIEIYTHPIKPLSFIADILQGCPPLTVSFNQPNYSDNSYYIWTFDDNDENNLSLDYNPSHTFTESGFYDITVQSTDSNGCKNQLTITDMINVYPTPDAMFYVDEDVVSFIDAGFYFDNHSIGNYYNYWAFDDGDSSLIENPYHNYTLPGYYYPKLIVENEFGCRDTAIKKIEVQDEFTLYVPTAFSPDNDGINDGFRAVGHGIDLDNYWIAVYDRWGELIWESNDLFEFWTANAKGKDKKVQTGTYTWLVVCKDFNGIEHTKNGPVTVIR